MSYPLDALYEEMSFVAYYLHWPHEQILQMEHQERRRWVAEVSRINRKLGEQSGSR